MTITSTAPERTSVSAISSACSPVSGCEISRSSRLTPSLPRVDRVERVLGVDERRRCRRCFCASAMTCSASVVLPERFRPVNLDDAAARHAADAQRDIQPERTRGDRLHLNARRAAEAHHRALAERLLDLAQRSFKRLLFIHFSPLYEAQFRLRHYPAPLFHTVGDIAIWNQCTHFVPCRKRKRVTPLQDRCSRNTTYAVISRLDGWGSLLIQRLFHRSRKLLQGEGLGQEGEFLVFVEIIAECLFRVTRHKDDLDLRIGLAQMLH